MKTIDYSAIEAHASELEAIHQGKMLSPEEIAQIVWEAMCSNAERVEDEE